MRLPKYRKHSQKDFGFLQYRGRRIRLPGKFGSQESRLAYDDLCRKIIFDANQPEPKGRRIKDLCRHYLEHAQRYYPDPRGEYSNMRTAMSELSKEFGDLNGENFGPLKLQELRAKFIEKGWSRQYINSVVNRIRRALKWCASQEMIPGSVVQSLATVAGLQPGRSKAKERPKIQPVSWQMVENTLPYLSEIVKDMVLFQWHTGVRSDSMCSAHLSQFAQEEGLLIWRPKHKNEFRGTPLIIPLGPKSRAIAEKYLAQTRAFLFRPPEYNKRYGKCYSTTSYRRAVQRGQVRAKIRDVAAGKLGWFPHQLRHAHGTRVRKLFGLEAAQAALGHASLDATQIYAERSLDLAKKVAEHLG